MYPSLPEISRGHRSKVFAEFQPLFHRFGGGVGIDAQCDGLQFHMIGLLGEDANIREKSSRCCNCSSTILR